MKFGISIFSSSTEELPHYTREIQHARVFRVTYPSRPKPSTYLTLMKKCHLVEGSWYMMPKDIVNKCYNTMYKELIMINI